MKIKDYSEREIRKKILKKISPQEINKNAKHWKGKIFINDIFVTIVKIPNDHDRIMHHNKSKYIARALKIDSNDFNRLIDCPMKSTEYYEKLLKHI